MPRDCRGDNVAAVPAVISKGCWRAEAAVAADPSAAVAISLIFGLSRSRVV